MASSSQTASGSLPSSAASASLPTSAASASVPSSPAPWWKDDVFLILYNILRNMKRSYTFKDDNELEVGSPILSLIKLIKESLTAPWGWKYDVFLSFRGKDTREGFLSHLYHELENTGRINTFMDDKELEAGAPISPSLLRAIDESRFAIIVLSPNYAYSSWCLEELTEICQCMQGNDRILPIFYHVDPSDVRKLKGSFEAAFTQHENSGQHREKMKQWRDALVKVANFSGWHTKNFQTERQLVEDIVKSMCRKVLPIEIEFTMFTGDFVAFEATREGMDKVMKAVKDDEVTAIGVYGMGGVGKTTMVEHVGAQAKNNGIFNHVITAIVSQNPNLWKIQGTLADLLGVKLKGETEIGRAAVLSMEIMRREKILIILDDVWKRIELSVIGIPSYKKLQTCNSKVILTTRIENVCKAMDTQKKITLNVLSEEDSWSLFVKTTGMSFDGSINLYNVARKVTKECAGLPVALKAVARALGDKDDLDDWEKAARQLQGSQPANLDDEGDVFKCIKLSYDYLKSEDAKSCFLLCSLFPEDYDINIEDLVKYATCYGLFQNAKIVEEDTIKEARDQTHSVVKYLKACSLILDSTRYGCIRMHDVIRDVAISMSKDSQRFLVKAGCQLKNWPKVNEYKGYSAISLMNNKIHKLPEESVCSKLQILLLQNNAGINEIPEAFFQCPSELRVLDLSNTSISLLPQSLSLLTNLQSLHLDSCKKIVDVSILGKLKSLEILSMRESSIMELPKQIGDLTNLKMLDFTDGCIATIPSKLMPKLHRLEELYMQCDFRDWGSKVEGEENNIGFNELTGLSYLNILSVFISDANCIPKNVEFYPNWVYFDICIGRDKGMLLSQSGHRSRSLILDTTINTLPPWFNNVVTEKTEKLRYVKCIGLNNILAEYKHGRLHGLKCLTVIGPSKNLKKLMNAIQWVPNNPMFENLEELHLASLYDLKELCVGELPPGSLCKLKVLTVVHCHNLGNVLLPSKLLQRLPNLEKLICNVMDSMEYVFGCEGYEPEQSKLRDMKLLNLGAVRSVCSGPAPHVMFQNLKSLFIYCCNILESVFTSDVAQCLFQLEDLYVVDCPKLNRVIEASKETVNNKKFILPKLKNLVLIKLPMLYTGRAIDIECPSLEHLFVYKCRRQYAFRICASDFHSRNQVQLNDQKHYNSLWNRLMEDMWCSAKNLMRIQDSVGHYLQWPREETSIGY